MDVRTPTAPHNTSPTDLWHVFVIGWQSSNHHADTVPFGAGATVVASPLLTVP